MIVNRIHCRKYTRDTFIAAAKEMHGDTYDYSSIIENPKLQNKMKIMCTIHGLFEQREHHHLSGAGCKQCGINERVCNSIPFKKRVTNLKKILESAYMQLQVNPVMATKEHRKAECYITCDVHGTYKISEFILKNKKQCIKCLDTKIKMNGNYINSEFVPSLSENGNTNKDLLITMIILVRALNIT